MIVATFQGPVAFGDPEANLETVEKALTAAEAQGAEILAMPETFLHGYFRTAELAHQHGVDLEGKYFAGVLGRLKRYRPTLLLGLNEIRGDDLYNTVAVIERGKLLGRYSKNFLVFRYFNRGHEFPVFEKRGLRYGIVICADTSYLEPSRILAMRGAQLIFTPHFNYISHSGVDDHTRRVRAHHVAIAIDNDVHVVRSNVVVPESQGTPQFGYAGVGVGDSFILDRRGRAVAEAGICKDALLVHEIPDEELKRERRPWQRVSPEIARALHDEYQQMFATHQHGDAGPEDESEWV